MSPSLFALLPLASSFFQQHFLKVLFLYSLLLKFISVFCICSLALPQRTVLAARACLSQDFAEPCRKTFFLLVELYNFTAPLLQLILWWIPEPFLLPAVWSACSAPAGTSLKSCSVCAFLVCVHTGCSTFLTFQLAALWCTVLLCARFVLNGHFRLRTGS